MYYPETGGRTFEENQDFFQGGGGEGKMRREESKEGTVAAYVGLGGEGSGW